jgi:hypothetical protein
MLGFREYGDVAEDNVETGKHGAVVVRRRMLRRLCFGLAVTSSVLALLAMSLGFSAAGVAGYVAAILPFAFFS